MKLRKSNIMLAQRFYKTIPINMNKVRLKYELYF